MLQALSTASGAERVYRRAVDKLTELLVAEGALHAVRLKQVSKTSRAIAYLLNCENEKLFKEIMVAFE